MKVEVLYVAQCPSHAAAVKLGKAVLAQEGLTAEIHEVLVTDQYMAEDLRFLGSPSIRINGQDVASDAQKVKSYALSCRLYPGSQQVGVPPAELVRSAIMKTQRSRP